MDAPALAVGLNSCGEGWTLQRTQTMTTETEKLRERVEETMQEMVSKIIDDKLDAYPSGLIRISYPKEGDAPNIECPPAKDIYK